MFIVDVLVDAAAEVIAVVNHIPFGILINFSYYYFFFFEWFNFSYYQCSRKRMPCDDMR